MCNVSIHAPAWGATRYLVRIAYRAEGFNPRSRVGSDVTCDDVLPPFLGFQSTLPRGERLLAQSNISSNSVFQSTLPRGERLTDTMQNARTIMFQSTLPRGERPPLKDCSMTLMSFNPRSRVGSDHQVPSAVTQRLRFQSTLPRGERLFHIVNLSFCRVSIHAPAWGATALTLFCDLGSLVSIHAPAWGAT